MEGALRDAGGADLAQAVPQLAPLPTPAPVLHFKHCKDEWDVDDAQGQQLVATMTQSMPGASEATKRGLAEVWEQLVGYPEAELIAALEEAAGDEDMEEEDDDDEEDDLPLALRATAPVGSVASLRRAPRMASAGTQTGGVREAGKVVTADKGATVDAGTLVRRLKVTMPLLKATHVDQGLTDLLLNYLIAATVKQGRTVHVPEGADVLPVPPALYAQERKILAAARVDDYEATEAALQANRERYARRQAGASRRGTTRRRDAGNMVVDKLLRDYVALLDHGLGEAAQEAQAVMATTAPPLTPAVSQAMPDWATAGALNCRGRMRQSHDQYVILLQVGEAPGAVTEALGDTGGARSLIDLDSAHAMGLQVHHARGSEYGTFYGPGGREQAYLGVVKGPIPLRFSADVVVYLRELKVIAHTEPLVLIGADVLSAGHVGWSFRYIGVGLDGQGLISFVKGRKTRTLPLVRAPHLANLGLPAPTAPVSVATPAPAAAPARPERPGTDPKLAELIALVKGQGWCL